MVWDFIYCKREGVLVVCIYDFLFFVNISQKMFNNYFMSG